MPICLFAAFCEKLTSAAKNCHPCSRGELQPPLGIHPVRGLANAADTQPCLSPLFNHLSCFAPRGNRLMIHKCSESFRRIIITYTFFFFTHRHVLPRLGFNQTCMYTQAQTVGRREKQMYKKKCTQTAHYGITDEYLLTLTVHSAI